MSKSSVSSHILAEFGYDKLHKSQVKPIESILKSTDTLVIQGTSSGKTAIALIPARMHAKQLTLIISPYIALMRNLVSHLQQYGIPADCLYSGYENMDLVYDKLKHKQLNILCVSPERLDSNRFWKVLIKNDIYQVMVDEVHCLVEWGNEFRPAYLRIGQAIKEFPKRPIISAMTATLHQKDIAFVIKQLGMKHPDIYIGNLQRKNIIQIKRFVKTEQNRYQEVKKALKKYGDKGSTVIYCSTKQSVEDMYQYLIEECEFAKDMVAKCYSGLSSRTKEEENFFTGKAQIMVATSAFGTGIDLPNIRLIILSSLPLSMANYFQAVGRAGRNGKKSHAILLYNDADYKTNLHILSNTADTDALDDILDYAESNQCMEQELLHYFGQDVKSCGHCTCCQKGS